MDFFLRPYHIQRVIEETWERAYSIKTDISSTQFESQNRLEDNCTTPKPTICLQTTENAPVELDQNLNMATSIKISKGVGNILRLVLRTAGQGYVYTYASLIPL